MKKRFKISKAYELRLLKYPFFKFKCKSDALFLVVKFEKYNTEWPCSLFYVPIIQVTSTLKINNYNRKKKTTF